MKMDFSMFIIIMSSWKKLVRVDIDLMTYNQYYRFSSLNFLAIHIDFWWLQEMASSQMAYFLEFLLVAIYQSFTK